MNTVPIFEATPFSTEINLRTKTAMLVPNLSKPVALKTTSVGTPGKIVLPTMEGLSFEKIKHITYLEAQGNYTMLHFVDGRQILTCKTLRDLELMLPEAQFVRIHRSHTIHLNHINKYVRGKGGYVVMQNGVTLTVSAGQKDVFLEAVKNCFG